MPNFDIALPDPPRPAARYCPYVIADTLVFVSGQLPWKDGLLQLPGRVGAERTIAEGRSAARIAALNMLAHVKIACAGDLRLIKRCVRIGCYIASASDFYDHPPVADGASELLYEVFGDTVGAHARFATTAPVLPVNACVMVEGVFSLNQQRC